jgi:hypothetical protein
MFKISKLIGIAMLSLIAWSSTSAADAGTQAVLTNDVPQEQMVMSSLSAMPLAFTENRGQFGEGTLFKANAPGADFYFRADEAAYLFVRDSDELIENDFDPWQGMADKVDRPRYKKESMMIKAQFVGANPDPEVTGADRLPHKKYYFLGNDPSEWHTDVPNYSSIMYEDIYPGIDLKYYGNGRAIKYDFIVNPGADMSQIRMRYEGVEDLSVTSAGDLQAVTAFGLIHEKAPYIYQEIEGLKPEIAGRYEIIEPGLFTFAMDDGFNNSYPLIIDPELIYSTYVGGDGSDFGYDITVDTGGNAYVTGQTASTDFPTVNPYQTDTTSYDVFVFKYGPVSGIEPELERPERLYSLENYPNPFNASTILTYNISEPGNVNLAVYNILGQQVANIFEGMQKAGEHNITWDATAFPTGVYFARIKMEEHSEALKMVLLK